MTARERAEKLLSDLNIGHTDCDYSCTHHWDYIQELEAAILASERDGYRRGVEDAAKEASGRCGMHVDFWDSPKHAASSVIVRAIRALLAKGEG